MPTPTDLNLALLIKANADQAKAQLAQVRAELAGVGTSAQQSSAQATAAATATATAAKAEAGAAGDAAAAVNAWGETEAQAAARIHAMVQASADAAEAERARAAAVIQTRGALNVAADANSAYTKSAADLAAAQTASMSAFSRARAPVAELQAILSKSTLTTAQVAQAEALLDRAQASGVISAGELAEAFAALDAAKIKDVAATEAQTAATVASNAALNARSRRELGTLLSEGLSGNVGRVRTSSLALANSMGIFSKLLTPMGVGVTALAGTLVALVAAEVSAEKQTLAFNQALAATGTQNGTTGAQLSNIAAAVGRTTGSYGAATAAVLALTRAGQGASPALEGMATLAVRFGNAIGDTKAGIELATVAMTGNAQQVADLDQKYNLLTATQANEVQHLFQIGEADRARQLIMSQGSQALATRAAEVEDSTGTIIKAWNAVTTAVAKAWNEMAHAGASDVSSRLKAVNEQLAAFDMPGMSAGAKDSVPYRNLLQQQADLRAQLLGQSWKNFDAGMNQSLQNAAKAAQNWANGSLAPIDALQAKLDQATKARDDFFAVPRSADESARFMRSYTQQIQQAAQAYDSATKGPTAPRGPARGGTTNALATDLRALRSQLLTLGNSAVGPVTGIWDQYNKTVAQADATAQKAIRDGGDAAAVQQQVQAITAAAASARDNALAKLKTNLQQQLAQATGDSATAARLQIQQQWGALAADPRLDADGKALVDRLINVQEAQAQLQAIQEQWQQTLADMARQEQTIQAEVQAGLISQYTGAQQLVAVHQQVHDKISATIPDAQRLADTLGSDKARQSVADMAAQVDQLQMHISDFRQALQSGFEGGLEQALTGLATGAMGVGQAFRTMAQAIAQSLAQSAAKALASKATDALSGLFGGKGADTAAGAAQLSAAGGAVAVGGAAVSAGAASLMASAIALQAAAASMAISGALGGFGGSAASGGIGSMFGGGSIDWGNLLDIGSWFADGGVVRGPGTATSDSIPARLSAGEYVVRAAAVRALGVPTLNAINRGYAGGGFVHPMANVPQPAELGFASPRALPDLTNLAAANDGANAQRAPETHIHVWSVEQAAEEMAKVPSFQKAVVHIVGNNPNKIRTRWGK